MRHFAGDSLKYILSLCLFEGMSDNPNRDKLHFTINPEQVACNQIVPIPISCLGNFKRGGEIGINPHRRLTKHEEHGVKGIKDRGRK